MIMKVIAEPYIHDNEEVYTYVVGLHILDIICWAYFVVLQTSYLPTLYVKEHTCNNGTLLIKYI